MAKSQELGMRTFDWSLFEPYNEGVISYDEAIRNADSANELRLNIKLKGKPQQSSSLALEPKRGDCCRLAVIIGKSATQRLT
jgi:twitching motility protein PilU